MDMLKEKWSTGTPVHTCTHLHVPLSFAHISKNQRDKLELLHGEQGT